MHAKKTKNKKFGEDSKKENVIERYGQNKICSQSTLNHTILKTTTTTNNHKII